MNNSTLPLANLVRVDAGFKPAVHLPDDFEHEAQNAQLIRTYIPTTQSMNFIAEVARSMSSVSNERARMLTGTFGTGKSDLLLMLCNYFSRPVDDPLMQPFYEKLRRLNEAQYATIYQQRANKQPFLVVLVQTNAVEPFPGFILHGLEKALKAAKLDALMLPTRYAAAVQKIEEWQREGHPVLQSFVTALRDNEAKEVPTLIKELKGSGADLVFPAFQRAFRAAAGTSFEVYGYRKPEVTFKHVAQALRERGTHSGILVVCDEFTEVLRRLTSASDQQAAEVEVEALGVQDLANTSIASGLNQLHFVVSSLESFASSSTQSASGTGSKTVEKIGGRFKHFELELQDSAELIRGAIYQMQPIELPNRQHDELVDFARTLWRQQTKQWVTEKVVQGCFPLHPVVTYALPILNSRVAQNNRTMFLFLKDVDGLNGFIDQHELASTYADWYNLLTLDRLFDYFEKSIQVRRSEIIEAYQHCVQLVDRITVDKTLAYKILKCIALCETIEPTLSPTRSFLRHALNLPPTAEDGLSATLQLLEEVEALYPPNDAGGQVLGVYSLPMAGRVSSMNLRQRVLRKARESHTSITRLGTAYPPSSIKAEEYNRRKGSSRELSAKYVGSTELNSATKLREDLATSTEGRLWYVVASSESERSDAQSRARELTRQNSRLVIAVPIAPLTVLDLLKNYEALQEVRNAPDLDSTAKGYLQNSGLVGRGFYTPLETAIAALHDPRQWEWFRAGASQPNITTVAQVQDVASKVMYAVYPHMPEHQLGQHFKADTYTPNLLRALTRVLQNELKLSKSGNKEEVIIRNGLTALGLAKLLRSEGAYDVYGVTEPTNAQGSSQKIWQLYVNHLSAKKPWIKLIDALREEPYGLYPSLLITFTAAFLSLHADAVEITTAAGQASILDEKVLRALIDNPQGYTIRLQPLSELQKQWLRGIVINGLKKPFDANGGQGKTLRSRVANQMRTWLSGLRLPLFAEKLDAATLTTLIPEATGSVAAAVVAILQAPRNNEEAIAHLLLNDVPAAFNAAEHHTWTDEQVTELLALWSETCRLLERLPAVLEQHAINAIGNIFGIDKGSSEDVWSKIYQWRLNRRVVESQTEKLLSHTRTFFWLAKNPSKPLREAFLEEFARPIIGISIEYQSWPSLDRLDLLVKEINKARDEVDARWHSLANAEEVWHDGVASATVGRRLSGVQADAAATYLHQWATSITWPQSAQTLAPGELQQLYPALDPPVCEDLHLLLCRTNYSIDEWKRDLDDRLAKQFGIESWAKAEVDQALNRLAIALKNAANIDALLRKYTLEHVLRSFSKEPTGTAAGMLGEWRTAHPMAIENDLDEAGRIVLEQIDQSSDADTTLLITLPRALPQVVQSYQQWKSFAQIREYIDTVARAVQAIERYTPLSTGEWQWLTGIVNTALHMPLINAPHEKGMLTKLVSKYVADWLAKLELPAFAVTLTSDELRELFPLLSGVQIIAIGVLLQSADPLRTDPATWLLITLPSVFTRGSNEANFDEAHVDGMLTELSIVCSQLGRLNEASMRHLLDEVGIAFGVNGSHDGAGSLIYKLRAWRQSYVLFAHETLSPDAALVSETLVATTDDPLKLLLTTLPDRLREVRVPYGRWSTWEQRKVYLQSLAAAASEIEQRGRVNEATPEVQQLWENLKAQISNLSHDEQRWLIKTFSEEFQP
jgi:hypothetical protein